MDADDHRVEEVLKEDRRFVVPLYQRKYQWAEHRLLPFWEDVEAKAAEVLAGESRFEHYMGALIVSPVDIGSQVGRTPVVQVVDGQQRLTTFQLFLAALREVARRHGFPDFVEHVQGYLFNKPKSKDVDPLTRFKLTPTPSDRELFHDLMEGDYAAVTAKYRHLFWGPGVPKNTPQRAFRAYFLFVSWIDAFVRSGPSDEAPDEEPEDSGAVTFDTGEVASSRLEALLDAVLERLKLVVISLGENDDAQVIFETLNSKGEPLLAMDLVRNNIFHRAERQGAGVEDLYRKLWDPLDAPWWREPAPNARPTRPRIDHFLTHVLAAETGAKVSMRELYAEYRAFAVPKRGPRFENVEDELRLLEGYAPLYETLEGRRDDDAALTWFGRKMAAWQVTTVYPVALQIGRPDVATPERERLLRLLYSYVVRRALCDLSTKNMNNVFAGLAGAFRAEGTSLATLQTFFAGRDGDSSRFPDDEELRAGILTKNAYGITPQPRLVDILWELEIASRTRFSEAAEKPGLLWIEHVMPRSWTADWPFEEGVHLDHWSVEPAAVGRRVAVDTLGNLTLIRDSLNMSAGNGSFAKKRAMFAAHTGLFLNKWFAGRVGWSEADIRDRGEHLYGLARTAWPALGSAYPVA